MTQTFQTNITVTRDADGTKGIFTVPTENGKNVLTMAEYINRGRARFEAEHYFKGLDNIQEDLDMLFCMLPAEDVAPVRHGRWVLLDECYNEGVYCSACHKKVYKKCYANKKIKSKFCPHCGAKMDGGAENG